MLRNLSTGLVFAPILALAPMGANAQQGGLRFVANPSEITLRAGEATPLSIAVVDENGSEVDVSYRAAYPRWALRLSRDVLQAFEAGEFEVVVTPSAQGLGTPDIELLRIPVHVMGRAIEAVEITAPPGKTLYVGTTLSVGARALEAGGRRRTDVAIRWTSSNPEIASVARDGSVTGLAPGEVTIVASADGVSGSVDYLVHPLNDPRLEITGGLVEARTGDVLTFEADLRAASGQRVTDAPITWAFTFIPDDTIKAPRPSGIMNDGRFVADVPGRYTILASAGGALGRRLVNIRPRGVIQRVEVVGQGAVRNVHTSDLWVFEGLDGRDYAITGTWSGDGYAYVWDVTDPASIVKTDSVQVDARTVNDVKVAPGARWAALSREGASDRRNGVVILDLADPAHPTIAASYDDGLTGGVHNMFATDDHLFALSDGDKYVILDMTDFRNPRYVSEYNHPNSRIHDVWVQDGIAYSSEWNTGVVVVDVGNGRWGGSIESPVLVTSFSYPVGQTHAAWPYFQESTGKFYLFLGDEISGGTGRAYEGFGTNSPFDPATGAGGVVNPMSGYVHIIDFTDPTNPEDVARYEVPEAGAHNFWIEDDVMYQAYYEGGLRAVDISGELMGDLFTQGREIAVFKAWDPLGFMPNQPNAWGPQVHKGHIFFSDFNSGLWAVKLQPKTRPVSE